MLQHWNILKTFTTFSVTSMEKRTFQSKMEKKIKYFYFVLDWLIGWLCNAAFHVEKS